MSVNLTPAQFCVIILLWFFIELINLYQEGQLINFLLYPGQVRLRCVHRLQRCPASARQRSRPGRACPRRGQGDGWTARSVCQLILKTIFM